MVQKPENGTQRINHIIFHNQKLQHSNTKKYIIHKPKINDIHIKIQFSSINTKKTRSITSSSSSSNELRQLRSTINHYVYVSF